MIKEVTRCGPIRVGREATGDARRGDVVSYGGDQWTANQWNYDEVPGDSSGAWNSDGPC
jgi:hypothetical protein